VPVLAYATAAHAAGKRMPPRMIIAIMICMLAQSYAQTQQHHEVLYGIHEP